MNLAGNVRSLWSGTREIFASSHRTTIVICPTVEMPAQVKVDRGGRLEYCSRWPHLQGCSQACMPQVRFSAEELEDFIARYEGKKCVCGEVLTLDDWYKSRLAALDPKTATTDVPVSLPHSFNEDSAPICSACYCAKM